VHAIPIQSNSEQQLLCMTEWLALQNKTNFIQKHKPFSLTLLQ